MDDDFPIIKSEQFPHDMGPWLMEKSENALKAVIELQKLLAGNIPNVKRFDGNPLAPYDIQNLTLKDEVNETLQAVLWDLTKIYAFSNGTVWDPSDRDLVLEKLDEGLEELQVKYGLLEKTKKQKHREQYTMFINKIEQLLNGERSPNRTLLHELFDNNRNIIDKNTVKGRFLNSIEDELDMVTNGLLEWPEFVIKTKDYLTKL
ncbi:hypothetical protein LQZ19_16290 [Treponema primitia]|uniref:hypothetical protein n=1 Tax=Treponema primitia TaxID=88058 RepID=UPI00397EB835